MKIPILNIHVLTNKKLERKLKAAKAEQRELTNKQMAILLHRNAKMSLALKNLAGGKRKN